MQRLSRQFRDWLAHAELVTRGLEGAFGRALLALETGSPGAARRGALEILRVLPRSTLALVLWTDAAEALWLDHEALEALDRLTIESPHRADVWYKRAAAAARLGQNALGDLERAAASGVPVGAADAARLELADAAGSAGDWDRAEHWLDQLSADMRQSVDARSRRAWIYLERGDWPRARAMAAALPLPSVDDLRGTLLLGRVEALDSAARAIPAFRRALLLDSASAAPVVQEQLVRSRDARLTEAMTSLVRELGLDTEPSWRLAFAAAHDLDALRVWLFPGQASATTTVLRELERLSRCRAWAAGALHVAQLRGALASPLQVAVLGEFNAGKSSLLNALFGADVAAVGVLPTTAALCRLSWPPDGADARSVELIDTPGFNAGSAAHQSLAERALSEAQAVIWVFDALQVLKASERSVLRRLAQQGVPVLPVVNKVDRLPDPTACNEVCELAARGLSELGVDVLSRVVPFSARAALASRRGAPEALARSGWTQLEDALGAMLARAPELRDRAVLRAAERVLRQLQAQSSGGAAEHALIEALAAALARGTGDS